MTTGSSAGPSIRVILEEVLDLELAHAASSCSLAVAKWAGEPA